MQEKKSVCAENTKGKYFNFNSQNGHTNKKIYYLKKVKNSVKWKVNCINKITLIMTDNNTKE